MSTTNIKDKHTLSDKQKQYITHILNYTLEQRLSSYKQLTSGDITQPLSNERLQLIRDTNSLTGPIFLIPNSQQQQDTYPTEPYIIDMDLLERVFTDNSYSLKDIPYLNDLKAFYVDMIVPILYLKKTPQNP